MPYKVGDKFKRKDSNLKVKIKTVCYMPGGEDGTEGVYYYIMSNGAEMTPFLLDLNYDLVYSAYILALGSGT